MTTGRLVGKILAVNVNKKRMSKGRQIYDVNLSTKWTNYQLSMLLVNVSLKDDKSDMMSTCLPNGRNPSCQR